MFAFLLLFVVLRAIVSEVDIPVTGAPFTIFLTLAMRLIGPFVFGRAAEVRLLGSAKLSCRRMSCRPFTPTGVTGQWDSFGQFRWTWCRAAGRCEAHQLSPP
jgi:hypothetical protein